MSAVDPVLLLIGAFDQVPAETNDKFIKLSDSIKDVHPAIIRLLTRKECAEKVCDLLSLSDDAQDEPMLRLNSDKAQHYLVEKFKRASETLDASVLAGLNTGTGKHQLILSMFAEYLSQQWYMKLKDSLGPAPDTQENSLGFTETHSHQRIDFSRMVNPEAVNNLNGNNKKFVAATAVKKKMSVPPKNNTLITAFFKNKN